MRADTLTTGQTRGQLELSGFLLTEWLDLEAGGPANDDPAITTPGRWVSLLGSKYDWGYEGIDDCRKRLRDQGGGTTSGGKGGQPAVPA